MNKTNNVRVYVNTPSQAREEVERIAKLFNSSQFEKVISFDVETMPRPGLEAYPTTLRGAIGVGAKRIHYMRWFQGTTEKYFNTEMLRNTGLPVPDKTGGKYAKPQWKAFYDLVQHIGPTIMKRFMWADAELDYRYWEHVLKIIVEERKKDPVQPGLEPADTDLFAVQYTLRSKQKKLYSWVFNVAKIDPEIALLPLGLDAEFIGQNIKYDLGQVMGFFRRKYPDWDYVQWATMAPRNVFCTQIVDTVLTLGLKGAHDLKTLASKHLGLTLDKEVRSSFVGVRRDELTPEQIEYSFYDTEILFPLRDILLAKAAKSNQVNLVEIFSKLSWVTAVWQTHGYNLSSERWLELTAKATKFRDEYATKLEMMLLGEAYQNAFATEVAEEKDEDAELNDREDEDSVTDNRKAAVLKLSQTAVVSRLAMQLLGFTSEELAAEDEGWVSEKTGLMSLGKDVRSQVEHYYTKLHGESHKFFGDYAKWTAYAKMVTTYGAGFLHWIHPITGQVQAAFRIAGTDTGRYASTSPNFLNLPRGDLGIDVRSAILAQEGYLIGGADFSAFEMRAAAALSQDPALLKIFENGIDMHAGAAILAFHVRKDKSVFAPKKVKEPFRVGANEYDMDIWLVPDEWTNEQMLDFALSKEGLSALLKVQKFEKDGSPTLDDDGNTVWEKPTRQLAKIVNFLIIFGGGAHTLAAKTNISVKQAEKVIEAYYEAFPALIKTIREWEQLPFGKNLRQLPDGRYVGFIEGRGNLRRWFNMPKMPGRHKFLYTEAGELEFEEAKKKYRKQQGAIRRQSFNLGPQGGNAVVTGEALLDYIEQGLPYGLLPWIAVYDEIKTLVPLDICEFNEDNKPRCPVYERLISTTMVTAATHYFPEVGFEADADPLMDYWKKF